ncbi:extracellular solute-binding protein [Nocardia fluminea]|uniref:extracellular solute-binding protein n=1 Tax=Nocardia fluminea TaxID=134984 RepID=UPI00371CDEDE
MINRKYALLAATTAATLALTTSCGSNNGGSGSLEGRQLVFVNFGSDSLVAAKAAWLDPFSKDTGVRFATDSPSDPAKVKAMVEAGNTTWDIIDLDTASGSQGCGTLYEKRTAEIDISHIEPEYLSDECGVPIMLQTLALVYNADKFGDNPPTSITDFLNTAEYPGKRITFNYAVGGTEGLLLADGTDPDSLYPLHLDRAAKVVKALGRDLTLLPSLAAQSEAVESGDFAMCWCYLGRLANSADRGAELGVVWQNAWSAWDMLYAIKGSKSPETQTRFLNYVATPAAQMAFTEHLPYGPTTPGADPQLPEGLAKWLLQNNLARAGTPSIQDVSWWNQNADKGFAAWTEMTVG